MTQAQLLADTLDKTRQLTKFFMSKLKEVNPEAKTDVGTYKANSLYWIAAHLVWAEDFLGIVETGGSSIAPDWVKSFAIKSDGSLPENRPDFKAVLDELKRVHELTLAHINSLTDEQLDEPNKTGFHFGDGNNTKRMMIQHCIRHEGTHQGQLSLIAKIYGQQTI